MQDPMLMAARDDHFREVLGHYPTGVAVVTAMTPGGPVGMAVNSFTSVSLAPPLVLFCPAASSTTWPVLRTTGVVAVNVLSAEQEAVRSRLGAWHQRCPATRRCPGLVGMHAHQGASRRRPHDCRRRGGADWFAYRGELSAVVLPGWVQRPCPLGRLQARFA
jgi:hypothetical protein